MQCPSCSFELQKEHRFCAHCGVRIEPDKAVEADLRPQPRTYTPAHLAEQILKSRSALEGERKWVTVLFCDIANSTPLAARLGPGPMHKLLNAFFETALAEVHRYEGTVNQFLGDGFMALFGAPVSHEDHARRAVLAALSIRQAVSAHAGAKEVGLSLRMGMNSGVVVVGSIGDNLRMDYTAIGDTTNIAARLQSEAQPGTILISSSVYGATASFVDARALGARVLKGKLEPMDLYELLQAKAVQGANRLAAQGADAFIGRASELDSATKTLEALADSKGGVLAIFGEAGLGKSRLMEETKLEAGRRGLRWLQGDCLSFGRTLSYWSFREVIRRGFGIDETDDELRSWKKLHQGMLSLFADQADEHLPYIGTLLALTLPEPYASRQAKVDALSMGHHISRATYLTLERTAQRNPTILAFEDWHWADASSAALLEHLLPLSEQVPVLFLVATRPETQGAAQSLRIALSPQAKFPLRNARTLRLAPLPARDATTLAESLAGGGALPPQVTSMLLRRSECNPFYLGELIRALIASQAIERGPEGYWRVTENYGTLKLPETIEGLILSRIDRLEEDAKQVLKVAAVVGRTFFYRVLNSLIEARSELDADLSKLERAELIGEKQKAPELEYLFKHPLIQQATYDSVVEERREEMHRKVGECVERLFASRLEAFYPVLAYHFSKGREAGKAREYLLKAADHADRLAADEEALELYSAVIADAEHSPLGGFSDIERAELDTKIGEAHFRAGRLQKAHTVFVGALERLGTRQPRSRLWRLVLSLAGVARMYFRQPKNSDFVDAVSADERLRGQIWDRMTWIDFFVDQERYLYDIVNVERITRKWYPNATKVAGLAFTGLCFDVLARHKVAERYHLSACANAFQCGDDNAIATAEYLFALHLFHAGRWTEAVAHAQKAVDAASTAGNSRIWAGASANLLLFQVAQGNPAWLDNVDKVLTIAEQSNDDQAHAWALEASSRAKQYKGEYAAIQGELEHALRFFRQMPDYLSVTLSLAFNTESLLAQSRFAEAVAHADEMVQLIKKYRLSMTWANFPLVMIAEVRLHQMEHAQAASLKAARTRAHRAIKTVIREGRKYFDESGVEGFRMIGTYLWLCDKKVQAIKAWEEGLIAADRQGARYAKAKLLAERGRRGRINDDLEQACSLFEECGAVGAARMLREASNNLTPHSDVLGLQRVPH